MNTVIDVKGLTKSFQGKMVVDHIDLTIQGGEVFGFLGPNGSGKTTTLRMLCGLMKPDEGGGTCLGHDLVKSYADIKSSVGYMPQSFSYYRELSVRDNLEFIATLYGLQDVPKTVEALGKRFGLADRMDDISDHLSGGWKQRMSLAASMMNNPKILLLDEPTAGVDPDARRYFWSEIHQIASEGVTVLVSTHFMDEAMRCDRLIYMQGGKKVIEGSQDDLIESSGVRVFEVHEDIQSVQYVMQNRFPNAIISMLSGRLRIVVKTEEKELMKWMEASQFIFEPVKPNIEEAFIYYSSGYNV